MTTLNAIPDFREVILNSLITSFCTCFCNIQIKNWNFLFCIYSVNSLRHHKWCTPKE